MNTESSVQNRTEDLIKLSFFTDIAKSIVVSRSVQETLDQVMRHIGMIFTPANWSLLLKDRRSGELTFKLVVGRAADQLKGTTLKKGQGIAGWVVENNQALIIKDARSDLRFDSSVDAETGFTTESIIAVPLQNAEETYGVIELINKLDGTPFTPLDLKLLTTIADFAAIAIDKAYYLGSLKRIAHVDPLTGLYNRRLFEIEIIKEMEKVQRGGPSFCLLFLDADNFKQINDRFGHARGDDALILIADVLRSCIRKEDSVFRYGGDEFAVVMPRLNARKAGIITDRIRTQLAGKSGSLPFPLTVSIGIHAADGDSIRDLVESADMAMYAEKQRKKEASIFSITDNLTEEL